MSRVVGLAKLASVLFVTAVLACDRSATAPAPLAVAPRLDAGGRDKSQELEAPSHRGGNTSDYVGRRGGRLRFDDASARGIVFQLDIPSGAVDRSTLFEMQVLPGATYQVTLKATVDGADVGAKGFKQPLRLTISYSTAKHPAPPGQLLVVWLPDDGSAPVPVKTQFNAGQKTVTGFLPHFSRYSVIF